MARAPKLPQIDTDERFLAQVAWAYHVEGLTQEQVALKPWQEMRLAILKDLEREIDGIGTLTNPVR